VAVYSPSAHASEAVPRPVKTLIENRTVFESHQAELSIYDTFAQAERVGLDAEQILYCGMISGRKTVHTRSDYHADFLPHESFVIAPGGHIDIDFPEATHGQPTTCLTLGINPQFMQSVCDSMNAQSHPGHELGEWRFREEQLLHTFHTETTQALLARLVASFVGKEVDRDLVLNLGVTELVARLVRQQGRDYLLSWSASDPSHCALTAVTHYIQTHLAEPIDIDSLCRVACMSRSKLYERFKSVMGCQPMVYVHQRRLERAKLLLQQGHSVTEVCYSVGYVNLSHFSRRFVQHYGKPPSQFAVRRRD
jgi:AraC-like DNA-binding protein